MKFLIFFIIGFTSISFASAMNYELTPLEVSIVSLEKKCKQLKSDLRDKDDVWGRLWSSEAINSLALALKECELKLSDSYATWTSTTPSSRDANFGPLIRNCYSRLNGKTLSLPVSFNSSFLCNQNVVVSLSPHYTILFDTDFKVSLSLKLSFVGRTRQNESLNRIIQTEACVESFYAQNGLNLDLTFQTNPFSKDTIHDEVYIYEEIEQPTQRKWGAFGAHGLALSSDQLCKTVAHEIGHWLGLPDRSSTLCPSLDMSERSPDDSIMVSSWGEGSISNKRLYPVDINTILGPACEEKK